ncbi:MAG: glycosyltransferase [Rhodospirillales bacterium]|nr:glycosyltransferase [Rhodospirillales bacterium]
MRLVIDLQAAQGTNKDRGIGRYSLALTEALLRQAATHEVWIALNDAFPDTIEPLRAAFDTLLPQHRIVVWKTPLPTAASNPANDWRRAAGEILREAFLASLEPEIVFVPSLFEGIVDDAVTSIGRTTDGSTAGVTIYDLIPFAFRTLYLTDPLVDAAYQRKLASLRRAGLWLPISEWSRREAIDLLDLPRHRTVVVPAAADSRFRPTPLADGAANAIRRRFGITRPFVMYTGGLDHRKNIEGLIGAYARLPEPIRAGHQLVVVCSADADGRAAVRRHAARAGVSQDELVLTGFAPDDELVALYNLCRAFCFPSFAEGFGLPALEAMQCGAPTIGADATSIPEVIGRADALFNPRDEDDMAARLQQVLTDEEYRRNLIGHGLRQARKYSWRESAARAWAAFEMLRSELTRPRPDLARRRPRLACVSPLPPERSGIADYTAELLPELARHYDIDVIADCPPVADSWVSANCPTRDIAWFDRNAHIYDRILYHFGNSVFHRHMFDLLRRHPGLIVLHDLYLSGVIAHMDRHDGRNGYWSRSLYQSHGYQAIRELHRAGDATDIIWKYPANVPVLQNALGIIVHSESARILAAQHYGRDFVADWVVVPQLRRPPRESDHQAARAALGFADHEFVVCSFGRMSPVKLSHRLLEAWLPSALARDPDCCLVFVGEDPDGGYADHLRRMIARSSAAARIRMTGFVPSDVYRQYLAAADAAIQLRSLSRGETSRAILDCMANSLPTIANAHGSLAELPRDCVLVLPDHFSDQDLVSAIEGIRADPGFRKLLGASARTYVRERHSPRFVADRYHSAIEKFSTLGREAAKARTLAALLDVDPAPASEREWLAAARALHRNIPPRRAQRQLLVDVSELVQRDVGTGIQRVVRRILGELLANPPPGYRVEPVYATEESLGYRYARAFTLQLLGCSGDSLSDAPLDARQGDLFLGLDLQPQIVRRQAESYAEMRRIGVEIQFVVYDLLPILMPRFYAEGAAEIHTRWLSTAAAYADGLICISRSVAGEVIQWLNGAGLRRTRQLLIGWVHLGADVETSMHTRRLPGPSNDRLAPLATAPSFLMVGTVEPRKGHSQALDAFERLWARGVNVNLVIVGREGWMVGKLTTRLRAHRERDRRLFWLERISDESLEKIYANCSCLLATSEGEGFGLPLIEAARHGLAILARDIPVFREVAGDHARYFRAGTPEALARAVQDWLAAFAAGAHEKSDRMPWFTWAESSERLKSLLLGNGWYARWPAGAASVRTPAGNVAAAATSSP